MTTGSQAITDAERAVLEKVRKLLDKAASSEHPPEQEAFQKKAEELLLQHNLDAAMVDRSGGQSGAREDARVRGGFYAWQQELWKAVAELNFCLYWTQTYFVPQLSRFVETRGSRRRQKRHRLVGRTVNTLATRNLAEYLEQAIERELLAICQPGDLMSNYAHSFRRGAAAELMDKIAERYRERVNLAEAAAKRAEADALRAAASGHSAATGMTIVDLTKSEEDANRDFLHGEGFSARQRAAAAAGARRRAESEARQAARDRAHPEEAAAREKKEEEESRKYWAKRSRLGTGSGPRDSTDYGAFNRGAKAARSIGLDPQAAHRPVAGRLR